MEGCLSDGSTVAGLVGAMGKGAAAVDVEVEAGRGYL